MKFTTPERRLLAVYQSGSAEETAAVMRDALPDIHEPDVRAAAESVITKLENMSGETIDFLSPESGGSYAG